MKISKIHIILRSLSNPHSHIHESVNVAYTDRYSRQAARQALRVKQKKESTDYGVEPDFDPADYRIEIVGWHEV